MELQISYYKSDDILLLQTGQLWTEGSNVAENVVVYADGERNIVGVEISGAAHLLHTTIIGKKWKAGRENAKETSRRPDETSLDRTSLPLSVNYDPEMDELILKSGLPTPFEHTIADGLVVYYDGEDEFGKFINAVKLANASKLLSPLLMP